MAFSGPDLKKQHEELDGLIEEFGAFAHTIMDKINQLPYLQGGIILNPLSGKALALSTMIIACKKYKLRPKTNQTEWRAELEVINKFIK
jgi:hypothetical protein